MIKANEKATEIVRSFASVDNKIVTAIQDDKLDLEKLKQDILDEVKQALQDYINELISNAISYLSEDMINYTNNQIELITNKLYNININNLKAGTGISIDGKVISVVPSDFLDICA